jgi:hypothetical protein
LQLIDYRFALHFEVMTPAAACTMQWTICRALLQPQDCIRVRYDAQIILLFAAAADLWSSRQ